MAMTAMVAIELACIPGKDSTHDRRQGGRPGSQQEMNMVGHQGPCEAGRMAVCKNLSKAIEEGITISVGPENVPSLDPTNHDVVESTWGVYSSFSRHAKALKASAHACH
jgi:hypothetical protein